MKELLTGNCLDFYNYFEFQFIVYFFNLKEIYIDFKLHENGCVTCYVKTKTETYALKHENMKLAREDAIITANSLYNRKTKEI